MVYKGYLVVERFCESCNVLYGLVVFYGFHLDLVGIPHHRRHSDCPASVPSTVEVEPMMVWVVWKWQEPRLTQAWIVHSLFHCLVPNLFVPLHWRKWASFPIIVIARGCAVFFWGGTATMRLRASYSIKRNGYNLLPPKITEDLLLIDYILLSRLVKPGSSCKHPGAVYKSCWAVAELFCRCGAQLMYNLTGCGMGEKVG